MRDQRHAPPKRARTLRKDATVAERRLWFGLRNLATFKFRRQHRIGRYIVDFYCAEVKLAVEVDGGIHWREEVRLHDEERDMNLRSMGIRIIRFQDFDAMWKVGEVVATVEEVCSFL
jgi:very-short-patch-repair endonuclease